MSEPEHLGGKRAESARLRRAEQLRRWKGSLTEQEPVAAGGGRGRHRGAGGSRVRFEEGAVFLAACSSGDTEEVKRLLGRGARVDTTNVDGLTALHQVRAVPDGSVGSGRVGRDARRRGLFVNRAVSEPRGAAVRGGTERRDESGAGMCGSRGGITALPCEPRTAPCRAVLRAGGAAPSRRAPVGTRGFCSGPRGCRTAKPAGKPVLGFARTALRGTEGCPSVPGNRGRFGTNSRVGEIVAVERLCCSFPTLLWLRCAHPASNASTNGGSPLESHPTALCLTAGSTCRHAGQEEGLVSWGCRGLSVAMGWGEHSLGITPVITSL